jgi:hypothetical protein
MTVQWSQQAGPDKDIAAKSGAQTFPACLIKRSRYCYCTQALDLGGKGAKLQAPETEPQRAAYSAIFGIFRWQGCRIIGLIRNFAPAVKN